MMKLRVVLQSCTSLILFLKLARADESELTLRQLNVIFRHGDRMPETFPKRFPNDPNMHDTYHPMGSGGLTNEGKLRLYRLGELLRRKYDTFLGPEYVEGDLYAISSSLARTKMSLQLVLAALYPPSLLPRKSRWHEFLDWQPIPTHYYDFRNDQFFNRDKCQEYIEELARVWNSSDVRRKLEGYESFLEELRLGAGKTTRITLDDVLILHNNLSIEKKLNMSMRPWMIDALRDARLGEMRRLYYEIRGYDNKLRRLADGTLVRQMNNDMVRRSNESSKYPRKVTLYSGHDKNLIGVMQALKIYDSHFPEFGSALIFELLASMDGQHHVKILYHLGIPEVTKTLVIPGCESPCPLARYLNLTKSVEISDEETSCEIRSDNYFADSD
ncbi:venom acid phosphatase Acph-1-like [Copidosoma floridanum]|uniref:venom acid phosphatase Acph-1-like n=1 Tax=Copidosoma floridanum TaxID=29053 RepID=UPI0006C967DB|nr:venom acid phosphatase Acph-1-like [Copidosoma floridanum]XP_014205849.1 venom acid phosphatase Acph-1-like [Copidosoma floridanum]